jgi:hypothetical protein
LQHDTFSGCYVQCLQFGMLPELSGRNHSLLRETS